MILTQANYGGYKTVLNLHFSLSYEIKCLSSVVEQFCKIGCRSPTPKFMV